MKRLLMAALIALSSQTVMAADEGVSVYGFCVKNIAAMMGPENHNISLTTIHKKVMDRLIELTKKREKIDQSQKLAARSYYWGDHLTGVVVYDYANCVDEDGECSAYRTEYFYEVSQIGNIFKANPFLRFNHLGTYYGDDQGPEMRYLCHNKFEKITL